MRRTRFGQCKASSASCAGVTGSVGVLTPCTYNTDGWPYWVVHAWQPQVGLVFIILTGRSKKRFVKNTHTFPLETLRSSFSGWFSTLLRGCQRTLQCRFDRPRPPRANRGRLYIIRDLELASCWNRSRRFSHVREGYIFWHVAKNGIYMEGTPLSGQPWNEATSVEPLNQDTPEMRPPQWNPSIRTPPKWGHLNGTPQSGHPRNEATSVEPLNQDTPEMRPSQWNPSIRTPPKWGHLSGTPQSGHPRKRSPSTIVTCIMQDAHN